MNAKSKRVKLRLFEFCSLVLMLSLGCVSLVGQKQPEVKASGGVRPEATYRGGVVTPPIPKPRFTLRDTSGNPFDFWTETKGYVTLLFFGYTGCPDVCPTHMVFLASALRTLPSDVRKQVKVVFVTTDPSRDNPESLRKWLNNFDKQFIGLSGDENAIRAAQSAANLPIGDNVSSYEHSAFILAYTKDNLAHIIYPSGITQSDWLHDLPQLVAENWRGR